jgi:lipoprotein-anchoring transpeptidase ErfK/SrfK
MHRSFLSALVMNAFLLLPALADPLSLAPTQYVTQPSPSARQVSADQANLGGGFIQFVFGGVGTRPATVPIMPQATSGYLGRDPSYGYAAPNTIAPVAEAAEAEIDPRYLRQRVSYIGSQRPGTIVIDTHERYLYLVEEGGTALRYGVGVGRPGFAWAGIKEVSMKRTWPDWRPPDAKFYGRRSGESAWRARALSRILALPYPWFERTLDHRHGSLLGLYSHAQRGCHRPL